MSCPDRTRLRGRGKGRGSVKGQEHKVLGFECQPDTMRNEDENSNQTLKSLVLMLKLLEGKKTGGGQRVK